MASVPEVVDPVVALVVCLALSDLIVVMGESKINSAGVDIDRVLF